MTRTTDNLIGFSPDDLHMLRTLDYHQHMAAEDVQSDMRSLSNHRIRSLRSIPCWAGFHDDVMNDFIILMSYTKSRMDAVRKTNAIMISEKEMDGLMMVSIDSSTVNTALKLNETISTIRKAMTTINGLADSYADCLRSLLADVDLNAEDPTGIEDAGRLLMDLYEDKVLGHEYHEDHVEDVERNTCRRLVKVNEWIDLVWSLCGYTIPEYGLTQYEAKSNRLGLYHHLVSDPHVDLEPTSDVDTGKGIALVTSYEDIRVLNMNPYGEDETKTDLFIETGTRGLYLHMKV